MSFETPEPNIPHVVSKLITVEVGGVDGNCVALSPDAQLLACGGDDRMLNLWTAATGKVLRTFEGHQHSIYCVEFGPVGDKLLASGSVDETVKLWNTDTGELIRTLNGHAGIVESVSFAPLGRILASGSADDTVRLWDIDDGSLLSTLRGHMNTVWSVRFSPNGRLLASGGADCRINLWHVNSRRLVASLRGHAGPVVSVAFEDSGLLVVSGSFDRTVKVWDVTEGKLLRTLEGHTGPIHAVGFCGGKFLASKSADGTIRLWSCETWETVAVIPEPVQPGKWLTGFYPHSKALVIASVGTKPIGEKKWASELIHLWQLDPGSLKGKEAIDLLGEAIHHTTAKIVLVGDSGVGKTGLGWRLAHGEFKEHSSTHGQQFWVLPQLGIQRADGTECEAILWDLAGQPDYRLIHALMVDDADLALVLFDPADDRDPLHGVEFWLKHLQSSVKLVPPQNKYAILVGARSDRGEARLTHEELEAYCLEKGIQGGYVLTSAKENLGIEELLARMERQIVWEQKPATVTTSTFKRIKDYLLGLKENANENEVIVRSEKLRERLEQTDQNWKFTETEMMTAVGHLANYGYVRLLRTSEGEERVLLIPELLNNLAASLILEARRNPRGLGSLEERALPTQAYHFRELDNLSQEESDVLLDTAALLFLEHNVCFRETDPLSGVSYLVFPELINLKKPILKEAQPIEDGVAYTASGAIENVYASLVVLLGYTQTFTRTDQWRSQARYVVGGKLICGFRLDEQRDGEIELVLYFGANVGEPIRTLFQGLFESFLARRNLSVFRYEPIICEHGHLLNRAVVRDHLSRKQAFAYCSQCGVRVSLPKAHEPIQLTQIDQNKVDKQRWFAERRNRFEQAVFQLASFVGSQCLARPECFVSYAWGEKTHEQWVERSLAKDLQKAGIYVILDRWENERIGASVPRFIDRIEKSDRVIMVGTPLYRKKYDNRHTATGYVVAAEIDLISNRLIGTEEQKQSVMPLLLDGDKNDSLPPLVHSRVYADFRNEQTYFVAMFDLILDIYGISHTERAVAELRTSVSPDIR